MRVLLFGSTGYIGSAVHERLKSTHDVVVASRSRDNGWTLWIRIRSEPCSEKVGKVDAVVATVGSVPFKPFEELQRADFLAGLCNKALGQVEIVRQGVPYVTEGGSFTLTTGVVGREPIRTGAAAALANGALEYFVPAAAVELPRGLRINAVSPTVLREAPAYHDSFAGFIQVPAATVAEAYVRSIEGEQTGRIYIVD